MNETREVYTSVSPLALLSFIYFAIFATTAATTGLPDQPTLVEFFDHRQVRAGQQAVAYTVFSGDKIEAFSGTVLGVLHNFFGPQRDVVLVKFEGEHIEHTGVVHGMSGSPVYVDGKLLGALALTLSPFPRNRSPASLRFSTCWTRHVA